MSNERPAEVWHDARWYLHGVSACTDGELGTAHFVHLEEEDFTAHYWTLREAEPPAGRTVLDLSLDDVAAARPPQAPQSPAYYVFHSAFCGSTLLTRCLAQHPRLSTLFEPRVLHDLRRRPPLRSASQTALVEVVSALLARRPSPEQHVVVKVHSACNASMLALLAQMPQARALFLYQDLRTFLAQVLKSEERRQQMLTARDRGELPLRRFIARAPKSPELMSVAEAAATAWLHAVRHYLDAAASPERGQLASLDSAAFFAEPVATLGAVAARVLPSAQSTIAPWLDTIGPTLAEHSKSPARGFAPGDRQAEVAAALIAHRAEVEQGLAWARLLLEAAALPDPLPHPLAGVPTVPHPPLVPDTDDTP